MGPGSTDGEVAAVIALASVLKWVGDAW